MHFLQVKLGFEDETMDNKETMNTEPEKPNDLKAAATMDFFELVILLKTIGNDR